MAKSKKKLFKLSFTAAFLGVSWVILLATTIMWAIKGAHLQSTNADQIVNPYLFENARTFKAALIPVDHTFLLKWPIFLLIQAACFSSLSYTFWTVVLSLATVGGLGLLINRIEERRLVAGTLLLALSSALLYVPPQPYSGGLLPVNMAMITTRNIEYLLLIVIVWLFLGVKKIRSWRFVGAVLLLGLLAASDKLFLMASLGGSAIMLVGYSLVKNWKLVSRAGRWFVGGVAAWMVALGILRILKAAGLTFVTTTAAGPYHLISSFKNFGLGIFYGLFGIATNFGANPAYDAPTVSQIAHAAIARIVSLEGLGYALNIFILFASVTAAGILLRKSLDTKRKNKKSNISHADRLAIALLCVSVALFGSFAVTDHYYFVDARYLAMFLFAGFVALAAYGRRVDLPKKFLLGFSAILVLAIGLKIVHLPGEYRKFDQGLASTNNNNQRIADTIAAHRVDYLVGDYWRVLPIKRLSPNREQQVTPLGACMAPNAILSSKAWEPDLKTARFGYVASLTHSLTNFDNCTLPQITEKYGAPSSSVVIEGTVDKPKELVLFYDHGINPAPKAAQPATPKISILPTSINSIGLDACNELPTVMNIVAHEDDDLLFMNPDTAKAITEGKCVQTVYLTAGDGGNNRSYWLSRQEGAEAAYSKMLGLHEKALWQNQTVSFGPKRFATVARLYNNPKVSLVFFNLPDGNLHGQGFKDHGRSSISKLYHGSIPTISSVDDQSVYTKDELVQALTKLMTKLRPTEIRTQSSTIHPEIAVQDHSDHITTAQFTGLAYKDYSNRLFDGHPTVPLTHYRGYGIRQLNSNLSAEDAETKEDAFFAYSQFDPATCGSMEQCGQQHANYYYFLTRQYAEIQL